MSVPITLEGMAARLSEAFGRPYFFCGQPPEELLLDFLAQFDPPELVMETGAFRLLVTSLGPWVGAMHVPMKDGGLWYAGPFRRIPITFAYANSEKAR